MRLRRPLWGTLLLWIALLPLGIAKKSAPEIQKKEFDHQPRGLFYFADSAVVLVTDTEAGIVWRSTDAGAHWERIEEITKGQASVVYNHPYDNKVAVALGKKMKHWITNDQGKTWRSFKTTADPVAVKMPLSFHATDSDRILFLGQECDLFTCSYSVR